MDEVIYVGHNYGRFQRDDGQMQDYCNVFVLQEFGGTENQDYHFGGQKAVKHSCTSPDVFKGIAPGTRVYVSKNMSGKISYMAPVQK